MRSPARGALRSASVRPVPFSHAPKRSGSRSPVELQPADERRLLGDVVGRDSVAQQPPAHAREPGSMPAQQCGVGVGVAGAGDAERSLAYARP